MWIVIVNNVDSEDCDSKVFGPWQTKIEATEWAKSRSKKMLKSMVQEYPEAEKSLSVILQTEYISVMTTGSSHDYLIREIGHPDSAHEGI